MKFVQRKAPEGKRSGDQSTILILTTGWLDGRRGGIGRGGGTSGMVQLPMSKSDSLIGKYAIMMRGQELKADLEGQASKLFQCPELAISRQERPGQLRSGPDIAEPTWMDGISTRRCWLVCPRSVCSEVCGCRLRPNSKRLDKSFQKAVKDREESLFASRQERLISCLESQCHTIVNVHYTRTFPCPSVASLVSYCTRWQC